MNQMREIDAKQGFDPSKERHVAWMLRKFILDNKKEALLDLQHNSEYLAGEVYFAESLYKKINNPRTFRTPLPADKIVFSWYCLRCGDLDKNEVTSDEITGNKRCSLCGESLENFT